MHDPGMYLYTCIHAPTLYSYTKKKSKTYSSQRQQTGDLLVLQTIFLGKSQISHGHTWAHQPVQKPNSNQTYSNIFATGIHIIHSLTSWILKLMMLPYPAYLWPWNVCACCHCTICSTVFDPFDIIIILWPCNILQPESIGLFRVPTWEMQTLQDAFVNCLSSQDRKWRSQMHRSPSLEPSALLSPWNANIRTVHIRTTDVKQSSSFSWNQCAENKRFNLSECCPYTVSGKHRNKWTQWEKKTKLCKQCSTVIIASSNLWCLKSVKRCPKFQPPQIFPTCSSSPKATCHCSPAEHAKIAALYVMLVASMLPCIISWAADTSGYELVWVASSCLLMSAGCIPFPRTCLICAVSVWFTSTESTNSVAWSCLVHSWM